MTEVTDLMQSHRSIRKFHDKAIDQCILKTILQSASSASTSSFLQCVSIVRVTDKHKRHKLVELTGNQAYVEQAAEFFVFCIDFRRHQQIVPDGYFGYTEQVILGSVDAALMGQNALLAAQSFGLGGVFIGGIRNNPKQVAELLALPQQTFALFGLCLGYPDQIPQQKPRLPLSVIVHENTYQDMDSETLAQYDQDIRDYYAKRTHNQKNNSWSDDIAAKLHKEARPFIQECLKAQGFMTEK